MVDIYEISAVVAAVGVLIGVVYYVLDMRQQRQERQTGLLIRIMPWLNMSSSELQAELMKIWNLEFTDYEDFVKRYGKPYSEGPEQRAFVAVVNYLDGLGILARKGLMDADLIYECWTGDIAHIWEKILPVVEGIRKEYKYPVLLNAEYLYNEMKKKEQKLQTKV
jgi:hypothetical protein